MSHLLRKTLGLSGCLLALLAGACSGKNTNSNAGVPLGQFSTQFGSAYCDSIAPCCVAASLPYDSATCKQTATAFLQGYVTNNSGKTYDAAAAGRCLDAVEEALHNCRNLEDQTTGVACAQIFIGSVPVGGACKDDTDCANDGSCGFDPNNAGGDLVCLAQARTTTHAKVGAGCNGDCVSSDGVTECSGSAVGSSGVAGICYASDGLYCSPQTQVCASLAQVGTACEFGGCVTGAFCDAGTCAAQRDSGSCSDGPEACSANSFCDITSGQCAPKKAGGAVCNQSSDCLSDDCSASATGQSTCAVSGAASLMTALRGSLASAWLPHSSLALRRVSDASLHAASRRTATTYCSWRAACPSCKRCAPSSSSGIG